MLSRKDHVPLPGSVHPIPPGIPKGAVEPDERMQVTIRVRSRPSSNGLPSAEELGVPLRHREYLAREEFEDTHGSDPKDLDKIRDFAHAEGLEVVERNAARRTVVLSGTVAALSNAFGVEMARYQGPSGIFRGHTGQVHVTEELAPMVEGVFGFDERPYGVPRFWHPEAQVKAGHDRLEGVSYTPPRLARLYDFPTGGTGHGQCIALLEFGGGYREADVKAYFAHLGIHPAPQLSTVLVDHGRNNPSDPNHKKEVMLDIAVAGAIAPGARIVVYFAPPSMRGWIEAITRAIHDRDHRPSVISISWGAPETQWPKDARDHIDAAFHEAAAMGITVCCASGDTGSGGGLNDRRAHVYFPASSPFVLACGGTRLETSGDEITSEVVWTGDPGEASSGGVSEVYKLPFWQKEAKVPLSVNPSEHKGRGVPDVAANASHYRLLIDGQHTHGGGTSAAAPLWAGLIARINESLDKPVGYLNPLIYALPANSGIFRDITKGSNGAYRAGRGWDACTGLGSPHGSKLLEALAQ